MNILGPPSSRVNKDLRRIVFVLFQWCVDDTTTFMTYSYINLFFNCQKNIVSCSNMMPLTEIYFLFSTKESSVFTWLYFVINSRSPHYTNLSFPSSTVGDSACWTKSRSALALSGPVASTRSANIPSACNRSAGLPISAACPSAITRTKS